ncbi:hypothetical protein RJW03_006574 [Pseudomonas aeruginosa]|uniref:hypothetical protein n=4 Tax=Pseudomonas aeruginosa TaxID=287 RepID=UPI00128F66C0|nr:hypothetical protein [Pseudomonas aeruginosa]EKU8002377.1 hypothetical protein [Pseudomonas aeruginosa]EKU8505499.1 hypothetical protein [Pseudomonas aeruginosa]EKV2968591.1 hypothetical protein [Pseudomonas aeruginosa]EKV2995999.1 hypothetical protein [Pseudomonas aeruginosa]ELC9142549.1 hypothetical protein [Pseudomonas aeruginosa]
MTPYDITVVNGEKLRLVFSEDKVWLRVGDLRRALGVNSGSICRPLREDKELNGHILRVGRHRNSASLIDEQAALWICARFKTAEAIRVIDWLKNGGMRFSPPGERLKLIGTSKSSSIEANTKSKTAAYCHALVCELLQHASIGDIKKFTHLIENEVSGILSRHPSEELNYARYDLFRRFYLQGGEK